jgi:hypothetical protein
METLPMKQSNQIQDWYKTMNELATAGLTNSIEKGPS